MFIKEPIKYTWYIPRNLNFNSVLPDEVVATFMPNSQAMHIILRGFSGFNNRIIHTDRFSVDSIPETEEEMNELFQQKCGHLIERYKLR